jgi:hypothetical protein
VATIFTVGLACLYWQFRVAEVLGQRFSRGSPPLLRALPVIGPIVLADDLATLGGTLPVRQLRISLVAIAVLQLAYAIILIAATISWNRPVEFDPWNGALSLFLYRLTHSWQIIALIFVSALLAFFMSANQTALRKNEEHCGDRQQHVYAHMLVNVPAVLGSIAVPILLLTSSVNRWFVLVTALTSIFAYLNGYRQKHHKPVRFLLWPRFWVHVAARRAGLVAAALLVALALVLYNFIFGVNASGERGFSLAVAVDPALLQRAGAGENAGNETCGLQDGPCPYKLPTVRANWVSGHRIGLQIDVPLAAPGRFVFAVTKFKTGQGTNGASLGRAAIGEMPTCSFDDQSAAPEAVAFSVAREIDNRPRYIYISDQTVGDPRLGKINCEFTDDEPDVLASSFTSRRVTLSQCCEGEAVLPNDIRKRQTNLTIDLHDFLADYDVTVLGGRNAAQTQYEPRIRMLVAPTSDAVVRSDRQVTAEWTDPGAPERREFYLIVEGSLLGLASVCILEWLREPMKRIGKAEP